MKEYPLSDKSTEPDVGFGGYIKALATELRETLLPRKIADYPLSVRILIVLASIWFGLNTSVIAFNLVSAWYIAALQAPGVIQQEKAKAADLQRQLDAEKAKTKPEAAK